MRLLTLLLLALALACSRKDTKSEAVEEGPAERRARAETRPIEASPTEPRPAEPAPAEPSRPAEPAPAESSRPAEPSAPAEPKRPRSGSPPGQGQPCDDSGRCGKGLTCVEYYGVAGTSGPRFSSCEIRCAGGKGCPPGQGCTVISDGPGEVCRP
jgi:hypothetical protein